MTKIKELLEEYGAITGIISLTVNTIALIGYIVSLFEWSKDFSALATIKAGNLPFESHKFLFALSSVLIIAGFFSFCEYLPTLNSYFSGKYFWVSDSGYRYDGGVHSIMFSLALVMPAIILWLKVFFLIPNNFALFLSTIIPSFVLIGLCVIRAFEAIREKINKSFVILFSFIPTYFVSLATMEIVSALITATIATAIVLSYFWVMSLFPEAVIYSVYRRTNK